MEIKIGDRITFRAATRDSDKRATRVVTGFYQGQPTVRYCGTGVFVVNFFEISAINGEPA